MLISCTKAGFQSRLELLKDSRLCHWSKKNISRRGTD